MLKGYNKGLRDFKFLSLDELRYMSIKSHIHGTLKKMSFCTKEYVEIYIQRPFFDIKKGIWKNLRLKIQLNLMLW